MNDLVFLLLSACGFVFAWVEFKQVTRFYSTYENVRKTPLSTIDSILDMEVYNFFEFNSIATASKSRSPITNTPCAAWEFEITQLKSLDNDKGNNQSVPIAAQCSKTTWILFESEKHVLGIKFFSDRIEMAETFSLTSVLNTELPTELSTYLRSNEFKKSLHKKINYLALLKTFGTSFNETILPTQRNLHVFGRVHSLTEDEMNDLRSYKKNLNINKKLIPFTVGGDDFYIGLDKENKLQRRLTKNIIKHAVASLLGVMVGVIFMLQIFSF